MTGEKALVCFVGVSAASTATVGVTVSATLVSVPLAMLRNLLNFTTSTIDYGDLGY